MALADDYAFNKKIPIAAGTFTAAEIAADYDHNYQVVITVHKGAGTDSAGVVYLNNCCINFPYDIRFSDGDAVTELDAWLDPQDIGTPRYFTVEVTDGLSDAQDIYIYYGGPAVTDAERVTMLTAPASYERQAIDKVIDLGATASATQVWRDDGGAFTNYTVEWNGAGSFYPTAATPAADDAFYVGYSATFRAIYFTLSTSAVINWTYTWEYYNGSAWVALDYADDSEGFQNLVSTGANPVTWIMPSDWASCEVGPEGSKVEAYYIRFRVVTYTGKTTIPVGTDGKIVVTEGTYTLAQPWVVEKNATYYCFYECLEAIQIANNGTYRVGVASSTSPMGPWTKLGYCFQPSHTVGSGYRFGVQGPAPILVGSTWYMFFAGKDGNRAWTGIYYCTISDANFPGVVAGATWAIGDSGNAQITVGAHGTWDHTLVACPAVFYDSVAAKYYLMWNGQNSDVTSGAGQWEIGIAESDGDAIPTSADMWNESANNPILPFGAAGKHDEFGLIGTRMPYKIDDDWYFLYTGATVLSTWWPGYLFCAHQAAASLTDVWTKDNSGDPVAVFPYYNGYVFATPNIFSIEDGALYAMFAHCVRNGAADQNNTIGCIRLEPIPKGGAATFQVYDQFNSVTGVLPAGTFDKTGAWIEEGQSTSHITDAVGYAGYKTSTFQNGKVSIWLRVMDAPSAGDKYFGIGFRKANTTDGIAVSGYTAAIRYGNKGTSENLWLWCAFTDTIIANYDLDNPDWFSWHLLEVGFHYDGSSVNTIKVWFDRTLYITMATDTHYTAAGYVQMMENFADWAGWANYANFRISKWVAAPPTVGTPIDMNPTEAVMVANF